MASSPSELSAPISWSVRDAHLDAVVGDMPTWVPHDGTSSTMWCRIPAHISRKHHALDVYWWSPAMTTVAARAWIRLSSTISCRNASCSAGVRGAWNIEA